MAKLSSHDEREISDYVKSNPSSLNFPKNKVSINLEKLDRADGRNDNKLSGKKKAIARKMAKTLDSATQKYGHEKMERRTLQSRNTHGTGLTKGYSF